MKLYGTPPTRVLKALWTINELGIDCEVVRVDLRGGEHLKEEFRRLNPAGKVPVLVDGDVVITESSAIPLYLAEKYPEKGLIPEDLAERGEMYRWIFFLANEIEAPLWRIARNTNIYPEDRRSPVDVEMARKEIREMAAVLERHMHDRKFLVGERLTVADLIAAYTLDWAREAKGLEAAPRLSAFVDEMYSRPTAPPTIAQAFAELKSGAA